MRRWMLVIALTISACSSATPVQSESTIPTVATFKGEVDFAAGTFVLTSEPARSGRAVRGTSMEIPEPSGVTVQNAAPGPWIRGDTNEHGCGTIPTWGSPVTITNNYASQYLAGTYVQITDFVGGGLNTVCNAVAAPSGMSGTLGLWSYGSVTATSITQNWTFRYVGGLPFTFHGKVLGAKMANHTVLPVFQGGLKANGLNMAYPTPSGIAFLDSTGTVTGYTTDLAGTLAAIAPDPINNTIWFVSQYGLAGYTASDGSGHQDVPVPRGPNNLVGYDITRDATSPDVAWFVATDYGSHGAIWKMSRGAPPALVGPQEFSGHPGGIAAAGTSVFVTNPASSTIDVWDTTSITKVSYDTATAGCESPGRIILGPDGRLWFTATNAICTITTGGAVAPAVIATAPEVICVGSDGNVWYTATAGLTRAIEGEATAWTLATFPALGSYSWCASGPAGFWATSSIYNGNLAVKVEP